MNLKKRARNEFCVIIADYFLNAMEVTALAFSSSSATREMTISIWLLVHDTFWWKNEIMLQSFSVFRKLNRFILQLWYSCQGLREVVGILWAFKEDSGCPFTLTSFALQAETHPLSIILLTDQSASCSAMRMKHNKRRPKRFNYWLLIFCATVSKLQLAELITKVAHLTDLLRE